MQFLIIMLSYLEEINKMKKEYIKPEILIENIRLDDVIAVSKFGDDFVGDNAFTFDDIFNDVY